MPIRRLCRLRRNGPGNWHARAVADGITGGAGSEVLEEFQERVRGLVAFLPAAGRGCFPDRFVLLRDSCPSQRAITVMSTPASKSLMAAECRRVWTVTCLAARDGQPADARS